MRRAGGAHEPAGGAGTVLRVPPDPREPRQGACAGGAAGRITQTCVVSLDDFDAPIEEVFQVRFVPAGEESDDIDPDSDDEIPFEGNQIDLGEATAEQLGLALDPYPRMEGVEMPEIEDDPKRIRSPPCAG